MRDELLDAYKLDAGAVDCFNDLFDLGSPGSSDNTIKPKASVDLHDLDKITSDEKQRKPLAEKRVHPKSRQDSRLKVKPQPKGQIVKWNVNEISFKISSMRFTPQKSDMGGRNETLNSTEKQSQQKVSRKPASRVAIPIVYPYSTGQING